MKTGKWAVRAPAAVITVLAEHHFMAQHRPLLWPRPAEECARIINRGAGWGFFEDPARTAHCRLGSAEEEPADRGEGSTRTRARVQHQQRGELSERTMWCWTCFRLVQFLGVMSARRKVEARLSAAARDCLLYLSRTFPGRV